ncbi:putative GPI-anchored protein [Candida albicans P60002]|nr:putative GPI-anchored protein [Candida albicans P60002]
MPLTVYTPSIILSPLSASKMVPVCQFHQTSPLKFSTSHQLILLLRQLPFHMKTDPIKN